MSVNLLACWHSKICFNTDSHQKPLPTFLVLLMSWAGIGLLTEPCSFFAYHPLISPLYLCIFLIFSVFYHSVQKLFLLERFFFVLLFTLRHVMVSFNLTEPKITWKESPDDGWPTVSCSVVISENSTISRVQVLNSKNEKKKTANKQACRQYACISFCSYLWMWHAQLFEAPDFFFTSFW